ncbi:unnamed protein product [Rhodiola kirilowii]
MAVASLLTAFGARLTEHFRSKKTELLTPLVRAQTNAIIAYLPFSLSLSLPHSCSQTNLQFRKSHFLKLSLNPYIFDSLAGRRYRSFLIHALFFRRSSSEIRFNDDHTLVGSFILRAFESDL